MLFALAVTALAGPSRAISSASAAQESAPSSPPPRSVERIDSVAASVRGASDLPGLGVAVVGVNGAEAIGVDGLRQRGGDEPLLVSDRVHLGSCAKAMSATLAAVLVRDGAIRWDSTVREVLGKSVESIDPSWNDITLIDLLRHEGGAPANPPPEAWAAAWQCTDAPRDCRLAFVRALLESATSQPRGSFTYSNQGYTIAGAMLEAATGRDFESLMIERLLTPLGISSAGFGPTPEAHGHRPNGDVANIDNPRVIAPATGVYMTLEDWGKFVALHLRGDGGAAIPLRSADFDLLHGIPESAPHGEGANSGAAESQERRALGWMAAERPWGGRVLMHAGSNTVWFCVAWLAPERGFALLAVTNQGGSKSAEACDKAVGAALEWHAQRGAEAKSQPSSP
ncbi:MAG: beta-lactamase family protein [Phycisphaeraceae bacterium]|nr:beta-lactamase family protein [Phycisphaeraceae bacterium]